MKFDTLIKHVLSADEFEFGYISLNTFKVINKNVNTGDCHGPTISGTGSFCKLRKCQ